MTSDKTIIEEIRAAYDCDDRIPHAAEIAIAEQGGTVTLRGTVGSPHQLRAAAEIAKSVRGVRRLDNELSLDPRDRWADGEIRGTALRALMSSDDVPADHIDVHVANGWLTLKGEVKHQEESDAAFAAVSRLKGVGGITNEIKVITAGIR
jgi:osmotically-inducible protein OsmY